MHENQNWKIEAPSAKTMKGTLLLCPYNSWQSSPAFQTRHVCNKQVTSQKEVTPQLMNPYTQQDIHTLEGIAVKSKKFNQNHGIFSRHAIGRLAFLSYQPQSTFLNLAIYRWNLPLIRAVQYVNKDHCCRGRVGSPKGEDGQLRIPSPPSPHDSIQHHVATWGDQVEPQELMVVASLDTSLPFHCNNKQTEPSPLLGLLAPHSTCCIPP